MPRIYELDQLIGNSDRIEEIRELIQRVSDSPANILITGERGTGKELVARVIHPCSARQTGPFVPIVCSTVSEKDWDKELFSEAHQGTLFFDEIGDLPHFCKLNSLGQSKLKPTVKGKPRNPSRLTYELSHRQHEIWKVKYEQNASVGISMTG